jgi:hypothetical protein
MPAIIASAAIEEVIRDKLYGEGYELSRARLHGQNGTDIIARKGSECLHIEAIAFKKSAPARAKDFYESFFRAVSRLKDDGATHCVLALPARFGKGLPQRAKAAGPAWYRIGQAFPELEIWLVDTKDRSIRRTNWSGWAS